MANKIAILTDTGCDNLDELVKLGCDYISLYITFDGDNYIKQNRDVTIEEFYEKVKESKIQPKTSLPSVMDFVDKFNEKLDEGKDILYLALDSKFSGTYQASLSARDLVLEERPEANIEIIDSLSCTYDLFVMVREACKMANEDKSMNEIIDKVNKMIPTNRVFMMVDNLEALRKSGRVSNISAALGDLLQIKPILKYEDGVLSTTGKVKGTNKALKQVLADTKVFLEGKDINNFKLSIIHGNHLDNAKDYAMTVSEELGIDFNNIEYCTMGVCIGLHAGDTLIGIGLVQTENL